jgi:mTERF domain-containing protein, mitochondrial
MSLLGSFEKVHNAIRRNTSPLGSSIEDVVKPNIALLHQCGLPVRHIAQVLVIVPRLLTGTQECVKGVILRVEELGVPWSMPMFRHALVVAYSIGRDTANIKMELMRSLGLSSSQVAVVVAKMPSILCASEDRLQHGMDFFTKEVGMDMEAIT